MTITAQVELVSEFLPLIEKIYPGWNGFQDLDSALGQTFQNEPERAPTFRGSIEQGRCK